MGALMADADAWAALFRKDPVFCLRLMQWLKDRARNG